MFDKNSYINCKNKTLIEIHGKDRFSFLQGIISNDVYSLRNNASIYASILTPQGRFFIDFFLSNYKDHFIIEIDQDEKDLILSKFKMFKLRSEVDFLVSNASVYLISNNLEVVLSNSIKDYLCFNDPRFENLFKRFYIFENDNQNLQKDLNLNLISIQKFNDLRLNNSIPDFRKDAIINKSLLMEMRFDELKGISWTKGCYMGQEITARMKYRNLQKRKLFALKIQYNGAMDREIRFKDEIVGNVTSHNKKDGLAYLNLKFIEKHKNEILICGNSEIEIKDPWWSGKD